VLEKMTLAPGALAPSDAEPVLGTGVGRDALVDAIVVAGLNMTTRLADSFGWYVLPRRSS